jgi:hypothetical protein
MSERKHFKLSEGVKLNRNPNQPVLTVVPDGNKSYLWIGNDAEYDKMCFATYYGAQNLRRLANAILIAIDGSEKYGD